MAETNKMNECLLIIDPQKDFTSPDGYYALKHKNISEIIKAKNNINDLLTRVSKNISAIIVYSDYYKDQFGENISMCIPDTEGHKIDIDKKDGCMYFSKSEHSAFSSFELRKYLNENGISKIYIAGFLAEYCVKQTAIDALKNNFHVTLLRDCIGTGDDVQKELNILFEEMENLGGVVSDYKNCF
jgi:nicotinamidase/pyrazinamidase